MKHFFISLGLFLSIVALAQPKEVSLVVFGEGETKEAAINQALRSAIEQAFSTFVSANTTILNDEIFNEEIVSISSGNIKSFKVIAVTDIPEDKHVMVSLQAEVSLGALVSFAQAHGSEVEFAGQSFLFNINKRKLDIQSEPTAIYHLCKQSYYLLQRAYDYEVNVNEPCVYNNNDEYYINVDIKATPNNNFRLFVDLLNNTLSSLSLSPEEARSWELNNMIVYPLSASLNSRGLDGNYQKGYPYYLRALNKSYKEFINLGKMLDLSPASFFLRVKMTDQECVYGPYVSEIDNDFKESKYASSGKFAYGYKYTIKNQGETYLKYAANLSSNIKGLGLYKNTFVDISYDIKNEYEQVGNSNLFRVNNSWREIKNGSIKLSTEPIVFHVTLFFTEAELSKLVSISVEDGSKKPIIYFFRLNYT